MDYYFYKHSLKYSNILNELNNLFTNVINKISEPKFITSSYCDYILNQSSQESNPIFIANDNNIDDNSNIEPLQIPTINDILNFNPNKNYYSDSEKLYGDYDDWKDYVESICNWEDYVESIYN
jgi:hypothetical protein